MSFFQALVYFVREAASNLRRSARISLLAIATIAVSLFIGGAFLLVLQNLASLVEEWRRSAKVVVYLEPSAPAEIRAEVLAAVRDAPWVAAVDEVTAAEARQRFAASFPGLAELLEGWEGEPLPPSLEISFEPTLSESEAFSAWIAGLRGSDAVQAVDDDRQWLGELESVLHVIAAIGTVLGLVLLAAAVFTIASVIRLTAFLYRDEISVMRLVGATEFFIRGPFYVEGLLQGLLGGLLAVGGLVVGYRLLLPEVMGSVLSLALADGFLPPGHQLALVAVGGLAGLGGAILSLRREAI
jgi:cell division transport system permease protein